MRRPYPSYQHSGVEWLGQVPEHWEVAQVRRWFNIVNGGTPASGDESYWDGETVWLTPDDLGRNSKAWISESRRRITDEGVSNSSARVSPEGSIILSTRAPIGHIAITAVPAATNQGCRTLVPNPETDSSFAYYSLIASRSLLQALGKGTTFMELTPTELGGFRMARPPLDEQQAIAAFLDRQTAKIDMLVAKKRLLLDRLAEYRTALITRTVTKGLPPEAAREVGLNPNPPLKPSGVEWLGEVPEHWDVSRLSRLVHCLDGRRIPLNAEQRSELKGEYPYWGANGIVDYLDDWLLDEDLVLLGEDGAPFFARDKCVAFAVSGKIWVNNHAHVLQPTGIHQKFLMHILNITDYSAFIDGSTRDKLTQGDMNGIPMLIPPPVEQRAISDFLDCQTERIDTLASRVEAAIERLQEYRTAVITAAVTGKIDVREDELIETGATST